MTQADALAMTDRSCFWADLVYCIQVGGLGDYFSDFDYEDTEPLTPEEQKRIDEMDLPF